MDNNSNMTGYENRQQKIEIVIAHAIKVIEDDGGFIGNSQSGYAGDANGIRSTKDKVLSIFRQDKVPGIDGNYEASTRSERAFQRFAYEERCTKA